MKKRLLYILLTAGVVLAAGLAAFTLPASAEKRTVYVKLVTGEVVPVTVDVPPGTSLDQIQLPGPVVPPPAPGQTTTPPPTTNTTPTVPAEPKPKSDKGKPQKKTGTKKKAPKKPKAPPKPGPQAKPEPKKKGPRAKPTPLRNVDGSPTPQNPGFIDALPGPSTASGVPNFIIRKFRVPVFLLPIYQAAGIQYGVRWEVLAAINEIETDYGRNLSVSTAGALGWMQFMPGTWRTYGVDANKDGRRDPYNPVDAIFAAARYLKAAGYEKNVRGAIFAYNHAGWYVDSVMLRARLIAGVPADLVGSLSGLTEGRFPVYARARYADDLAEQKALKKVKHGNAANLVQSSPDRTGIDIYSQPDAPAVAVNDGVVKKMGSSKKDGRFLILQDVYGNSYKYSHLGSVARFYPVPKADATDPKRQARALQANQPQDKLPAPTGPASAGRQAAKKKARPAPKVKQAPAQASPDTPAQASVPIKQRLFAHPDSSLAREAGGLEQLLDAKARGSGGFETFKAYFSRPFGMNAKDVRLTRLKTGSHLVGGTIIGRLGRATPSKGAHLHFEIRPAGKGAPRIDPKPILDGWKLLEATAIYRASGRNALYGTDAGGLSIGQVLLMAKPQLERRVLADPRIDIYPGGRSDIQSGQIDRKVLATLEYLAESGLKPTVSCLKSGHGFYTSSGNVSEHSSGNAVDISKINGVPVLGHQERGGVTETAVKRLMRLQGTMRPHQIISLLDFGGNTLAMGDHNDHIHVGFHPLFGDNKKLGAQALAVLKPGQWSDLIARLRKIDNPVVPTNPSRYALPVPKRSSGSHLGE